MRNDRYSQAVHEDPDAVSRPFRHPLFQGQLRHQGQLRDKLSNLGNFRDNLGNNCFRDNASERTGNSLKGFADFHLKAKATIWP